MLSENEPSTGSNMCADCQQSKLKMPQGLPFKDCEAHSKHLNDYLTEKILTIHSTRYEGEECVFNGGEEQ